MADSFHHLLEPLPGSRSGTKPGGNAIPDCSGCVITSPPASGGCTNDKERRAHNAFGFHYSGGTAAAPSGGFWVSLKSAPDEKAIQQGSDRADRQIQVCAWRRAGDLENRRPRHKGVTYRAVAGPLNTRQEAMELCEKIKGVGGDKACFVTN